MDRVDARVHSSGAVRQDGSLAIRLYVAASLEAVEEAREVASQLTHRGFRIVSTWHGVVRQGDRDPCDPLERRQIAETCVDEIRSADALVMLADVGTPRGTYVELGFALALRMPVVYRAKGGRGRCVFDGLPNVVLAETDHELLLAAAMLGEEIAA